MPLFASSLILKEENIKGENAYAWAVKMNYFCVRVGSVRLSILELHNFLKQLSTPTVSWRLPVNNSLCFLLYVSENRTVFRAGLFYSNNFILEHQSCFIWLFYLPIFFTEGSKPSPPFPSAVLSRLHGASWFAQDLVFLSIILKSQDY